VSDNFHKIVETRSLTKDTFLLRFERKNMQFRPGQRIVVGLIGEMDQREYSVYSSQKDDFLEILVKEVPSGNLSAKLKQCKLGQMLHVNGPFGSFIIEEYDRFSKKLVFIATGTGISPFHSFVRSYPGIDYLLIHGVRYKNEAYDRSEYEPERYVLCTSSEITGNRKGRVTDYLKKYNTTSDRLFYLCGNGNMIYDAYQILRNKGVPAERIFSEIYF
jgi:ferredoxin--NADP+ reductase/benzoate/toluate 1,2-dioxygenase reductase subunit